MEDDELLNLQAAANLFLVDEDEENLDQLESSSPVIDSFIDELGNDVMITMCGFTISEFNVLWSMVEQEMVTRWTTGRGKKSPTKPKDAFFMLLSVFRDADTWDKHAVNYTLKAAPTFQKMMKKTLKICGT